MFIVAWCWATFATFAAASSPLPCRSWSGDAFIAGILAGGLFPISLALVADRSRFQQRQVAISKLLAGAMLGNLLGASLSSSRDRLHRLLVVFYFQRVCHYRRHGGGFIGFGGPVDKLADTDEFQPNPAELPRDLFNPMAKFSLWRCVHRAVFLLGVYPFVAPMLH